MAISEISSIFTPDIKLEQADERGEVYSISLPDNRELMLFHSKAGYLRGGHSHDVDEVVIMLSGRMNYYKTPHDKLSHIVDMQPGDTSRNCAEEPHMGDFLEDSWLIEYKINTPARSAVDTDYEPYKKRMREQV